MTQREQLELSYQALSGRFYGKRLHTITHFWELFIRDTSWFRNRPGPLLCTSLNQLLIEELMTSGLFSEQDIQKHWTFIWYISPHQYLKIKTEDGWTSVDLWANKFGITLGDYAHGFHA